MHQLGFGSELCNDACKNVILILILVRILDLETLMCVLSVLAVCDFDCYEIVRLCHGPSLQASLRGAAGCGTPPEMMEFPRW